MNAVFLVAISLLTSSSTIQPGACDDVLVTAKFTNASAHDALHQIAKVASVNLVVSPEVKGEVSISFVDVSWRTALRDLASALNCRLEVTRDIYRVFPRKAAAKGPRLMFNFQNAKVEDVVSTIAKISGANVIVDPEVTGRITVHLKNVPWREALNAMAETSGWQIEDVPGPGNVIRITAR